MIPPTDAFRNHVLLRDSPPRSWSWYGHYGTPVFHNDHSVRHSAGHCMWDVLVCDVLRGVYSFFFCSSLLPDVYEMDFILKSGRIFTRESVLNESFLLLAIIRFAIEMFFSLFCFVFLHHRSFPMKWTTVKTDCWSSYSSSLASPQSAVSCTWIPTLSVHVVISSQTPSPSREARLPSISIVWYHYSVDKEWDFCIF